MSFFTQPAPISKSISRPAVADAMTVRFFRPSRMISRMSVIGWLSAPKPPIATVIPSLILDAASSIDVTTSLRFLLTLPSSMEIGRPELWLAPQREPVLYRHSGLQDRHAVRRRILAQQ